LAPRVFLVERSEAATVRTPTDPRLVELGRLPVDRKGNGRMHIVVPNVPPGEYTTMIYCRPCGRYSRGRTLLPAGRLHVTEAAPLIRDCSHSFEAGLRGMELSAGPLTLSVQPLATLSPERFAPIKSRPITYRMIKIVAVLQNGAAATLTVPVSEQRNVALQYRTQSPINGAPAQVTEGDAAVTFKACTDAEYVERYGKSGSVTQFGGGFVVAGARCASVIVRVEGRSEPLMLRLPFGASCLP
jgi:hypothetical protein